MYFEIGEIGLDFVFFLYFIWFVATYQSNVLLNLLCICSLHIAVCMYHIIIVVVLHWEKFTTIRNYFNSLHLICDGFLYILFNCAKAEGLFRPQKSWLLQNKLPTQKEIEKNEGESHTLTLEGMHRRLNLWND